MKILFIILILNILFTPFKDRTAMAQHANRWGKTAIKRLLQSTTYVVLDNDSTGYNESIKKAVEKYWQLTEYKFITRKAFEQFGNAKDNSKSFLIKVQRYEIYKGPMDYLCLNMGNERIASLSKLTYLAFINLSYSKVDEEHYLYKLPNFVQNIQSYIKLVQARKIISVNAGVHYYEEQIHRIRAKTLYIEENDIFYALNNVAKIKSIYKDSIKIVTKKELAKAIEEQDSTVVYLHSVGPRGTIAGGKNYNMVFEAKGGDLLYEIMHEINPRLSREGLREIDLKNINGM